LTVIDISAARADRQPLPESVMELVAPLLRRDDELQALVLREKMALPGTHCRAEFQRRLAAIKVAVDERAAILAELHRIDADLTAA
jgi:hypothetical protein